MNKTELTVYVHPTYVKAFVNGDVGDLTTWKSIEGMRHSKEMIEAKLIINLETDPKVQVTRSQFDEAWKEAKFGNGPDDFKKNIMAILFKK